jgi:hypothetical protein
MNQILLLGKLYSNPVLVFYIYYCKMGHKSLKEWGEELADYRNDLPDNPMRVFVEMMSKYGT